jgi:signal transduction histidine kinase
MPDATFEQKKGFFLPGTSISFRWNTCMAAVVDIVLLSVAFLNYQREYVFHIPAQIASIPDIGYFSRSVFYIDFYFFFTLYVVFLFLILFSRNKYVYICSLLITVASAVLLAYTVNDLFTIKLFVFVSWILTCGIVFPARISIPVIVAGCIAFAGAQFYPSLLGIVDMAHGANIHSPSDLFTLIAYFFVSGVCACMYRFAVLRWEESDAVTQHLNMIMTQMSQFNQKLQDAAKNRGKEAATQERFRITRDMHDSCGYVFVNIVGLMEASESSPPQEWSKTKETFETVRSLASRGLQETRRTLRAIRDIQNPIENSLDALKEIKTLFEGVTNITVEMDEGNMKCDYGRTINTILIRTMQEALTNAVRHGRATYIGIYFWDDESLLTMTVKDNGVGSKQVVKGIGLAGMEERLARVGGTLETETQVEGGFRLTISIPLIGCMDREEEYGKTENTAC